MWRPCRRRTTTSSSAASASSRADPGGLLGAAAAPPPNPPPPRNPHEASFVGWVCGGGQGRAPPVSARRRAHRQEIGQAVLGHPGPLGLLHPEAVPLLMDALEARVLGTDLGI